ncbi:hypothetical protein PYCCODRAFT_1129583 [Trametes coccinea BRFM310]|uniref:Uncharacterized protein n=1 Tax=Trametes coccinea (strain BRFM310) TaxID=1353009 RepID=A0A1Y2IAM8_TRAC3|nr:hypothetical protein PYCCODRAFT_1129583 [Trametes coccinea BRFM310]
MVEDAAAGVQRKLYNIKLGSVLTAAAGAQRRELGASYRSGSARKVFVARWGAEQREPCAGSVPSRTLARRSTPRSAATGIRVLRGRSSIVYGDHAGARRGTKFTSHLRDATLGDQQQQPVSGRVVLGGEQEYLFHRCKKEIALMDAAPSFRRWSMYGSNRHTLTTTCGGAVSRTLG